MSEHAPHPGQSGRYPAQHPGQPPGGHPGQYPGQYPGGGFPPPQQPPQQPPQRKNKALPWILGCGCLTLLVLAATVGIGGYFLASSGGGQAEPAYAKIPFSPCRDVNGQRVEKIVPNFEKEGSKHDSEYFQRRICDWTHLDEDSGVSTRLSMTVTVDLKPSPLKGAKTRVRATKRRQQVRRVPNLGDLAYASEGSGTVKEAMVAFSKSNLFVSVSYAKNDIDTRRSLPYKKRHKIALTWAKRIEQRV